MREIEIFLPLSFLAFRGSENAADTALTVCALLWSGIFLFFPLFNRDRLRVGDLLAGTRVVHIMRSTLGRDLVAAQINRERWTFSDDALDLRSEEHTSELQSLMRTSYAVLCL